MGRTNFAFWSIVTTASILAIVGLPGCGGNGIFVIPEQPASIEFSLQPSDTVINDTFDTTVVFRNAAGDIMPISGLTVDIFLENNPTAATMTGTTQAVSEFGVCYFFRTLQITEESAGYTLRAETEVDGVPLVAFSDAFEILPKAVGSLVFDMQPTPTVEGDPFMVSVALQDQTGQFLDRSDVPIELQIGSNPSGGILSGTLVRNTVDGIATFPGLSIDEAGGGYTLRAQYLNFVAFSGAFSILPPPPAAVAFVQQPPNTPAGDPFGCVVEIRDAGGGTVPLDGLQVTVAIQNNAGGGTLSGTKTVASVQGVCTFTDLSIDDPADGYTLLATHQAFTDVSAPFNIEFTPPAWDPNFGTDISMSDDGSAAVNFSFTFPFYGNTYSAVYVNDNGNLTFNSGDSDFSASANEMASDQPRIAPWWGDLQNANGGGASGAVYARVDANKVVITYDQVVDWNSANTKSMQVTFESSGRIILVWGAMTGSTNGLFGISPGGNNLTGGPVDFSATVFPSTTNATSTFPYETGLPDLANGGWIIFDPLGSPAGSGGYTFTTG